MSPEQFLKEFGHLAETEGGINSLRGAIVDLAVAGRLNETTLTVSMKDIIAGAQREQLVAIGKGLHKPAKDLVPLAPEERAPSGWAIERLGALLVFGPRNGYSPKGVDRPTNVRVLTLSATTTGKFLPQHCKHADVDVEADSHLWLSQGDLLIQRGNSLEYVGVSAVVDRDVPGIIYPDLMMKIRAFSGMHSKYLWLCLSSTPTRQYFRLNASGTSGSMPKIAQAVVNNAIVKFPPLPEQKRIVEKVDQLMALCDELEAKQKQKREKAVAFNQAALNAVVHASDKAALASSWSRLQDHFEVLYELPENVKQLRQTILQLAVMGKLVRQDPEEEPAALLLSRVAASSPSHGTAKRPKPVEIRLPTTELPRGWNWTNWRSLVSGIESGWSPQCEETPRSGDAWGVLKVSAVSWDRFLPDENKALPSQLQPRAEAEVRQGDFLMSRANTEALVGRSVIVVEPVSHLLMSDKLLRCYFNAAADPEYVNYFNRTHWARAHYATYASGTSSSMKNISREVIGSVPVPLPPLAEQGRIVARVTELLRVCAELDAALSKHQRCGVKLMHSVVNQLIV